MAEDVALLLSGIAIGFFGGLFGIGGAIFATSLLALCFGYPQAQAQGTGLLVAAGNTSLGLIRYHRYNAIPTRLATVIAVAAVLPNGLGGWIGAHLAGTPLRIGFALVLIVLAALSVGRLRLKSFVEASAIGPAVTIGVGAGLLNGIFGAGGGLVAVPVLRAAYGLSQTAAQALLLFISLPIILPGLVSYALAGDVHWRAGLLLTVGGFLTVPLGARVAHAVSDRTLRLAFAALLVFAAVLLAVRAR